MSDVPALQAPPTPSPNFPTERNTVLHVLSAAAFLIFFQTYAVAPLIPSLAKEFHSPPQLLGLLVPSYMLAYAFSTLFYGPLSDRTGRRLVLLFLIAAMALTTAGLATARTVAELLIWRGIGGAAAGGIIPLALALIGDLFPYQQRGRALGWIFGAIAGGMAFGSTAGAFFNPFIGWRWLLILIAAANAATFLWAYRHQKLLEGQHIRQKAGLLGILQNYLALMTSRQGFQTYSYVALNGIFHSGIFTWLGLYFAQRYHLGDIGIGLALLGYGLPGMLLGPAIGRAADRLGRRVIIPIGLSIAALSAAALAPNLPIFFPALAVTLLSLGLDMSHPLLAGIVTSLDPARRGQAVALNAFVLFTGFGLGPLAFQALLQQSFATALLTFATIQFLLALLSIPLFKSEAPNVIKG